MSDKKLWDKNGGDFIIPCECEVLSNPNTKIPCLNKDSITNLVSKFEFNPNFES